MNAPSSSASIARTIWNSPLGPLGLVARNGKLARVFLGVDPRWFPQQVERTYGAAGREVQAPFREVIHQLREYFEGKRLVFRTPLDLDQGTPFQRKVWRALQGIPYGETVSYKEIARTIGQPSAARAVGGANGANPIPIIVPCHRVVASDRGLGGYSAGLEIKTRLLELEARARTRATGLGLPRRSASKRSRPA